MMTCQRSLVCFCLFYIFDYIEMSNWTTATIMCNQWPYTDIIFFKCIMFFHNEAILTFDLTTISSCIIKTLRNLEHALSAFWEQQ